MKWLTSRSDWQLLSVAIIFLTLFKAWLTQAAGFELHYDEAQYWEWSQQLDWSYYSKGPLIAWLIALSEQLFGHGEWQVRLFGWLFHDVFLILIFYFTYYLWKNRTAAWWAFLITLSTPMYFVLGLVMTTDNILLVFWLWALWSVYRALIENIQSAWYQAGLAVGIGALSKLSIGLLPAFVGVWMIFRREWHHHFKSRQLWIALLILLGCMSPLIYWNAANNWVMFRHEFGHIVTTQKSFIRPFELILAEILLLSPIVCILAIGELYRKPESKNLKFLWVLSLSWIVFFIIKAYGSKVQLNWLAASFTGFIILFAGTIPNFSRRKTKLLFAGTGLSAVLLFVIFFPQLVGIDESKIRITARLKAWSAPIEKISAQYSSIDFILTDTYPMAAEFAFYWPTAINVYIAGNKSRRYTQHDLWPSIDREKGNTGLYVGQSPQTPTLLTDTFTQCETLKPVMATNSNKVVFRTFYLTLCENYQALEWPQPGYY